MVDRRGMDRARRIGKDARGKFQALWAKKRPQYAAGEPDAAAGYATMMASYTEATGLPTRRPRWQRIHLEVRPQ